jgi:Na+/citrate or Na+/malate symporter
MPFKKIAAATLFSLPLVPFLLLPVGTLDGPLTIGDLLWAAPFILEFTGFYALYLFTKRQDSFSKHEQKQLLTVAVGFFAIVGIALLITQIVTAQPSSAIVELVVMLGYALTSLVITTKKVSESSTRVKSYFAKRYLWPGIAAISLMFTLIILANVELNAVTCYFIFKNYVFALSED